VELFRSAGAENGGKGALRNLDIQQVGETSSSRWMTLATVRAGRSTRVGDDP
jgi:hypothetical protein